MEETKLTIVLDWKIQSLIYILFRGGVVVTNKGAGKLPFAVLAGLPIDIHKIYVTHMTTIDSCNCAIYYLSVLCQQISSLFARILLRRLAGSTAYSLESIFKCDQRSD